MATISLNYRPDEIKKNGEVPLFVTFSHNGKQYAIRLGESFPFGKLEKNITNGVLLYPGKDKILIEKEKRIRSKTALIELETEKAINAKADIVTYVKNRLNEESGKNTTKKESVVSLDFIELFDLWTTISKSRISTQTGERISKGTIKNYASARSHFNEFSKTKKIDIISIDNTFYNQFSEFMLRRVGKSNTISKYISILKVFMRWAEIHIEEKYKIQIGTKFTRFEVTKRYTGVSHLTSMDLKLFQEYKTNNPQLQSAIDIFLLLCYTGASVVDRRKVVDEANIQRSESMLIYNRSKTTNRCIVPFFDDNVFKPVELINKYKLLGRSFPNMGDQKINELLKIIQKEVGFERFQVTTKIGRKTFATIKHLEQGVPSHIVMRATGHTTEKSFLRYIGIDESAIIKQFKSRAQY